MTRSRIVLPQGAQCRVGRVLIGFGNVVVPSREGRAPLAVRMSIGGETEPRIAELDPGQSIALSESATMTLFDIAVSPDGERAVAALEFNAPEAVL